MTIKTNVSKPAWTAKVTFVRRCYRIPAETRDVALPETLAVEVEDLAEAETRDLLGKVSDCYVDMFRPSDERIRFRVNRRKGRWLTFSDPRDRIKGIAGTTGLWGTLPPQPAVKPRPSTLTEFRAELARLIGAEKAQEIIKDLLKKFPPLYDSCQTRNVEAGA